MLADGIYFPDSSFQATAFPGFAGYAPLASPALTGNPTAPTPTTGDNDTSIATTAFVQSAIIAGSAHAETLQATVRNNTGATLSPFTVVYITGAVGNKAAVGKAQANAESTSAGTFAITESSIANNADGVVISAGVLSNVNTSAYTDGDQLYLSPTTAGAVTTTKPSAPNHLVYIGVVTRSHPTLGTVSVRIQNGPSLEELHNVAISSLANNDLLAYESSTTLWKNKTFSALGLLTSATAASTYAPIASPSLTGTPLSTTAAVDTNTTQIATTAYVVGQGYAKLASPTFSGTPSLPTGTTATTQTAGDNTTKLATTAFVTAAVPAFATLTNVIGNPSSTTLALNPSLAPWLMANANVRYFGMLGFSSISGGSISNYGTLREIATTAASQRATYQDSLYGFSTYGLRSPTDATKINFSKKHWIFGIYFPAAGNTATNYYGDANTVTRINLGGRSTNAVGALTQKGIGLFKAGGTDSLIYLTVHNGTTLTSVSSGVTNATGQSFKYVIYSDGTGNVTLYLDGVSVATTSAGPIGLTTAGYSIYEEQVETSATFSVRQAMLVTGAGIIIER
jgi:hypothetical protein